MKTKLKEVCDYVQNVISEHFVFYSKQLVSVASGGIDRVILLCFPRGKNCLDVIINKELEAHLSFPLLCRHN